MDPVTLFQPVVTEDVVFVVPVAAIAPAFLEHASCGAIAAVTPGLLSSRYVTHTLVTIFQLTVIVDIHGLHLVT